MNLVRKIVWDLRSHTLHWVLGGVVAAALLVVAVYFGWSAGRIVSGVTVNGQPVGGMKLAAAERVIGSFANQAQSRKVILSHQNRPLTVKLDGIGIAIDVPATVKSAYLVGRSGSIFNQVGQRWQAHRQGIEIAPVFKNRRETLNEFFHLLDAAYAIEPIRSVVTLEANNEIHYTPSRTGRVILRDSLIRALQAAVCNPKIAKLEIPVKIAQPSLTEAEIAQWEFDKVLGSFTTKFSAANPDRTHNLTLAANAINNALVYPGQHCSFNAWVGPRVTASGYKEAPVVILGKLVPGIGGGICQVSTTLYNAALLANLKTVQRLNHSLPSAYIPMGRDATVSYGDIDFVFANTNATPVLVVTRVAPPYLTVAVLGKKVGWEAVQLETKLIDSYPFKEKEIPDPELPAGERIKAADGTKGFKVELWRTVQFPDGSVKKTRENVSIYPAQPEEYKVGTKVEKKVEETANSVH